MEKRRRWGIAWIAALSLTGTTIGCRTTPVGDFPPLAQSPGGRTAAQTPNLSPQRTAKLALETAIQMEKSGHLKVAVEQYEKARQLDPKLTEVAHRLAVLHDRQGEFKQAAAEYKKAVEARPKDADLLNDQAYHYYQRGDWVLAEASLRKALAVNPKHERAWINLGMALAQQGKVEEAFKAFTKVVSPADAKSNIGMILAQNGKKGDAKAAFRESLEIEPDAPRTRAALAQLEKEKPPSDATVIRSTAPPPSISPN
ncbi:MAG: tetratricopeptide repeat protein [Isosphaeraceae bacterium]